MGFKNFSGWACAASICISVSASPSYAALAFALTDNNALLSFNSGTPTTLTGVGPLRTPGPGSQAIQDLIGIDFRPATNTLYGVGKFGAIYTINTSNAEATLVTTLTPTTGDDNPFDFLRGSRFGFDFNPVVDRLRINSDLNQNLRVNVTTGATITDTNLAYTSGDPNFGKDPNVVGAGYTNNTNTVSGTTLYVIDSVLDVLAVQNPANSGALTTVGDLKFDTSSLVGFDIQFDGVKNVGYAALQNVTNGVSHFFSIDLATGNATPIGTIGGGDFIDGIAVAIPVAIPEPTALSLLVLAGVGLATRRRRD